MKSRSYAWQRGDVHRVLSDLVRTALARIGHDVRDWGQTPLPEPWELGGDVGPAAALDSYARMTLAAEVAEWFGVRESGLEDLLIARRGVGDWLDVLERSLRHFHARITFRTSGSTDVPKPVHHALTSLDAEAATFAERFRGRKRVVSLVPAHHVYGFIFTVLLPARLGVPVVDGRDWNPAGVAARLRPGDLVVGHPAIWALIARLGDAPLRDVAGVTSTAPCPDALAHQLDDLGVRPLLQVYGSTETGGVGIRETSAAPFRLLPHWQRAGDAIRPSGRGLPAGPARALMDRVDWLSDREFLVRGRKDAVVQVAGHNVSTEQVLQVLRGVSGVADAAVRRMSPEEGEYLKAFLAVTAGTDRQGLLARVESAMRANLPDYARPRHIALGDALPRAETGKLSDWSITGSLSAPDIGSCHRREASAA